MKIKKIQAGLYEVATATNKFYLVEKREYQTTSNKTYFNWVLINKETNQDIDAVGTKTDALNLIMAWGE